MSAADQFSLYEVSGVEIAPWLDALGGLRIRVFREYPYLYDGNLDYERTYLRIYQECPDSLVVLVTDPHGSLIGATTCMPLAMECAEFREPFEQAGYDVGQYLYLGESIVLPAFRRMGLSKEFFSRREAHACRLGLSSTTFCAVTRPANHPLRPRGHRDLDGYWSALGYVRQPHLQAVFSWKEIDETVESHKTLGFWTKALT